MFFDFPFLKGRYLYYQEYFILVLCLKALFASLSFLLLSWCFLRRRSGVQIPFIPRMAGAFCLMLASVTFSWTYTSIAAFRYMPVLYAISGNVVLFWLTLQHVVHIVMPWAKLRRSVVLLVVVLGSCIYPLVSLGACVCFYEDGYETFEIFKGYPFNTQLARYGLVPEVQFIYIESCPNIARPCFIYPTLPPDATTSVFINVHTHTRFDMPLLLTMWEEKLQHSEHFSEVFEFDDLATYNDRNVHTFLITELQPNTTYSFRILFDGEYSQVYYYRSLADIVVDNSQFIMVNGGDIGNSALAIQIWRDLAVLKPDIILIGGDISYDNNLIDCAWTMDYLLRHYQEMSSSIGRLVPLVLAIGNHDIGLNAGAEREVQLYDRRAQPIYYSFFPQHYEFPDKPSIPKLTSRKSFFYHTFANIVFFTLDTEYAAGMKEQGQWINATLAAMPKATLKMAHYHNPIFWACFGFREDAIVFQNGLLYWTPLFEHHRFAVNFENHAHEQKRTKFLKGAAEAENGTLYLGDGSWGATVVPCSGTEFPDYVHNWQPKGSVWVTTVTNTTLTHVAVTEALQVTDQISQPIEPYLLGTTSIIPPQTPI